MFATLRSVSALRSSLLRPQNVGRLSVSSSFAFRLLSTSRSNFEAVSASPRFVYLGNLPWRLELEELKEQAEKFGTLESINIPDDENGRTAGFANVEFASAEEAQNFYDAALESSLSFQGRKAQVELFNEPQTERLSTRRNTPPSTTLFIGRIPFQTVDQDIRELFSPYGPIKRINIAVDGQGPRGYGHIEFETVEASQAAMEALNGSATVHGSPVKLDYATKVTNRDPPNKKLYLARYDGDFNDLQEAFKQHQSLNISMLRNRNAIIEFETVEQAVAAKEALDRSQTPSGHTLNLYFSKARPTRTESTSSTRRRSNSYGNDW